MTKEPKDWKQHDNEERNKALGELGLLIADNPDAREALADVIDEYFTSNEGGYEVAKTFLSTLRHCSNDEERFVADMMFISIFGWSIATLTNDLKHLLAEHYGADVKYDAERHSGLFNETTDLDVTSRNDESSEETISSETVSPAVISAEEKPKLVVPIRGGNLVAESASDPDNPGIWLSYTSDKYPDMTVEVALVENTNPELLPVHIAKREDAIRTLCYSDPWSEEYTHEHIIFGKDVDKALASVEESDEIVDEPVQKVMYNEERNSSRTAVDILWDTDGDQKVLTSIPREIAIPEHIEDEEISDYISDMTGFCHKGFAVRCGKKEEKK